MLWTFVWTSESKPSWAVGVLETARRARLRTSGESEEGHLGNEAAPPEADDRELAAGDELVGEGPGDPEQLGCLADAIDETLRRCGGITVRCIHEGTLLFEEANTTPYL